MSIYRKYDLRAFLNSISQEEKEKQNLLEIENTQRIHSLFIADLKIDKCNICGMQMDTFNEDNPCFHWFTYPPNIKKKHFEKYFQHPISFFRLDSYFRWLANFEKPIGNINDLKDETSATSYLESTYRYKNIEWAFSIGHTDKDGHVNAKVGSVPHYHIQMKVNGNIFLKFNDFHIAFTDEDLFFMELKEQAPDKIIFEHQQGHGIGILEDEEKLKIVDDLMKVTDDVENATFNRQTIIEASEGQIINMELYAQALAESKLTKEPIGKILQRLLPDVKITTIISPGDGVPKMTKRSGKK